jgi:hypothetical protein
VATHFINEGSFELVGLAFTDRTVHVFEGTHAEHGEVNLVVHRAEFPRGKSLRELVSAHVARERGHFTDHVVLDDREIVVAGAPALAISSRHRAGGQAFYQSQTHLAVGDVWMYFVLSASTAIPAACEGWIAEILASLQLRDEELPTG